MCTGTSLCVSLSVHWLLLDTKGIPFKIFIVNNLPYVSTNQILVEPIFPSLIGVFLKKTSNKIFSVHSSRLIYHRLVLCLHLFSRPQSSYLNPLETNPYSGQINQKNKTNIKSKNHPLVCAQTATVEQFATQNIYLTLF